VYTEREREREKERKNREKILFSKKKKCPGTRTQDCGDPGVLVPGFTSKLTVSRILTIFDFNWEENTVWSRS
jgi:hypothetical protein